MYSFATGKYRGFYHADSDTLFVFRMYEPQDKVSLADLAYLA